MRLSNNYYQHGHYSVTCNGPDKSSGVYFIKMSASGFIGKPIVNKLLMKGCEVLAIGREIPSQQKLDSLHWLKANFSSPETYQTEINAFKPEVLIHLAWQDIPDYSLEKSI